MKLSVLFRDWWVILIQGLLMIAVSILIFNNPNTLLAAIAFYLGWVIIITGVVGLIAYFSNKENERETFTLLGSVAIVIIGVLMITNIFATVKAITMLFGLLVTAIGLVLLSGSWKGRKKWSLWWVIAILGACSIITGLKSIFNSYEGAESISSLVGIAVMISGVGMIFMAILKKKIAMKLKSNM